MLFRSPLQRRGVDARNARGAQRLMVARARHRLQGLISLKAEPGTERGKQLREARLVHRLVIRGCRPSRERSKQQQGQAEKQSFHALEPSELCFRPAMRIAKPVLLVSTPIGVAWGLYEAWKVRWWLGLLMAVLVGVIGLFSWMTVRRIQLDRLADEKAAS